MNNDILDHVPMIDFSESRVRDEGNRRELGAEIDRAFMDVGFFYAVNHGVPRSVIDEMFSVAEEFYAQPDDRKNDVSINEAYRGYIDARSNEDVSETTQYLNPNAERMGGREMFTLSFEPDANAASTGLGGLYGPNNWPAHIPRFKDVALEYLGMVSQFSERIMRGLASGLGLAEMFFVDRSSGLNLNQCTVLHYLPLAPSELEAGVVSGPSHTDVSLITCLFQDDTGGLQVRPRGSRDWIDVPPVPDTFVVNGGDLLSRWTDGRYDATPHRVVNSSGRERFSLVVGCYPRAEVVVDPRDLGSHSDPPQFQPTSVGDHLRKCYESVYGPN